MFTHQAYGLNIISDFFLPVLPKGNPNADIYLKKDTIGLPALESTSIFRQGNQAYFGVKSNSQEAYLQWSGVGSFLAQDGNNLTVDPDSDDIEPELLNLYILSEALGLILYQRGFFLLHASAVKIGDYAVVIVGAPGAGKSTMAAAFAKHGYPVLADDMVAINNIQDIPTVYPAFPQIKIWPATIKGLDFNISNLSPLFPGSRKRVIRQPEKFTSEPCPLAGIFALDIGNQIRMTPMTGTEAFMTLTKFFPCPAQLLQNEALEKHFSQCIQLLKSVPAFKLERPQDFSIINQVITTIENKVNSLKNVQDSRTTV
ncbi:hypothetical protein [Pleurocapsa sp. PCC 7319]|uniref:hypothetical protein n=1 Tax=Pleurocapsa sp. PCC 7319 TaxID=118161 RepID=UPI00034C36FA|nr:hypothetical protein [Pleurocapsa sp. PCC 7319]